MQLLSFVASVIVSCPGGSSQMAPVLVHTASSSPVQTRVLQEQALALNVNQNSHEDDKRSLSRSMGTLHKSRSSAEAACMRERIVLKEKLRQTAERADDTIRIAKQLQAANMEFRSDEADAKGQFITLQHKLAESQFDEVHLKESVKLVLKEDEPERAFSTNQSVSEMVALAVSSLREDNRALHVLVLGLKANLSMSQQQLRVKELEANRLTRVQETVAVVKPMPATVTMNTAMAGNQTASAGTTSSKSSDDVADEMVQTLQAQNMDLQREHAAAQLDMKGLQGQIADLKDDKAHLLGTLQSAMAGEMTLRQQLTQMTQEKDEEIGKMREQLAQQAKDLAAAMTPQPHSTAVVEAAVKESPVQSTKIPAEHILDVSRQLRQSISQINAAQPSAAAIDPISEMSSKAAEQHHQVEEMKKLAFDPLGSPLSAWAVAPEMPLEDAPASKPARLVSWLGARSNSKAASWSPVDELDPQAVAEAQKAQTFDEKGDEQEGDSVTQLLSRAESMVSGAAAAA